MFVPLNQTAKVSDLIQGIAVQNANDGAIAVAEGLAGTDEAFGQMMTEEARALGLEKSTFGNSSGLPNPANLVTARELAKLSMYVIKEYPEYYKYFGQKEFKYRTYNFKNINPLLNASIPVDGLKLGFTENVGYGIAASAEKDGRRLVAVMNGFESERDRREEALKMLSWGFVSFRPYKCSTGTRSWALLGFGAERNGACPSKRVPRSRYCFPLRPRRTVAAAVAAQAFSKASSPPWQHRN